MKLILCLIFFAFGINCNAQVQKYILTTGGGNYVTVTIKGEAPQDYTRGYLGTSFSIVATGDTQMAINYQFGFPSPFIPYVEDTNYQNGDASNANFPSIDSLYRWTRRHLQK